MHRRNKKGRPAREDEMEKAEPRKIRTDLTREEAERLAKYGSLEFKSAGAVRKAK